MGQLRDEWLALEQEIPNDRTADPEPDVLNRAILLLRHTRGVLAQYDANPGAMSAMDIALSGEARWVEARIVHALDMDPPGAAQVITRDDVIEMLRDEPEDPDDPRDAFAGIRNWLIVRLGITDRELANQMRVTLSRDAITLLQARAGAYVYGPTGPLPFSYERRVELAKEIEQALTNASPEEDE